MSYLIWNPIETAPKEKTILVWGKWLAYPFQVTWKNNKWVTAGNVVPENLTHWIELPTPPQEPQNDL